MILIFLTAGNVQLAGLLVEREEVEAHRARDDQRHANTGGVLLLFALFTSNVFRGYNFFRGSIYGSQCLKLSKGGFADFASYASYTSNTSNTSKQY